ncbi:MAG TPA: hypothetical protein VFQ35_02845, partial [Polyangiaceae bacterium]|nr:hypothetical protein [Polyangiaceae bacterium]
MARESAAESSSNEDPRRRLSTWPALLFALTAAALPPLDTPPTHVVSGMAISGCSAVVELDVCELPREQVRTISVWIPRTGAKRAVTLRLVGATQSAPTRYTELASGTRIDASLRLDAAEGSLTVATGTDLVTRVGLKPSPVWRWQSQVAAASASETLSRLAPLLAGTVGAEHSQMARAVAESAIGLGEHRRGFEVLADGARVALAARRYSEARSHLLRLAFHQSHAHDFAAAETALERARAVPSSRMLDADGEAAIAYVSAVEAANVRDLRRAAQAYEDGQSWVERGAVLMAPQIAMGSALIAEEQGRLRDALALLESALKSKLGTASPCFRALATTRAGWYALELYPRDDVSPGVVAARERLRQASAIYKSECTKAPPAEPAAAGLYLGFAALRFGELEEARAELARAGEFASSPRLRLWANLLGAEIHLAQGRVEEAERSFRELELRAQGLLSGDLAWRASEGLARTFVARHWLEAAVTEFRRAESLLISSIEWVSIGAGALQFLDAHREPTEGLAATLIAVGRISEGYFALRRARRRLVVELARNLNATESSRGR